MKPVDLPPLEPQDVHVWHVLVDEMLEDWTGMLHPDEIARADRFVFRIHRKRYGNARGTLRLLLGSYLDVPPPEIRLRTRPGGKPFVEAPDSDLRFNVSHSHGVALYAFTWGVEVGVDIERKRSGVNMQSISSRFFSPREAELMRAAEGQQKLDLFYRLWTLKEAYAKGTGEGIGELLNVEVLPNPMLPSPWQLHEIESGDDFAAAVAVAGDRHIQVRNWPPVGCTL